MKPTFQILTLIVYPVLTSLGQTNTHKGLRGNNLVEFVQDKKDKERFIDPIDDSVNFKKVKDNIYKDDSGKFIFVPVVLVESRKTLFFS